MTIKDYRGLKRTLYLLMFLIPVGSMASGQSGFREKLSDATIGLTKMVVTYDGTYYRIPYPEGDVPAGRGVCTDVIIRAYRVMGIDLQREVHEDMVKNFNVYPKYWGLKKPDPNIDHRRVPNLMKFFTRYGKIRPVTVNPEDYFPGDIVCWDLGGGIAHIGIVVDRRSEDGKRYLVVHNIGGGQVLADCLFRYRIIGHYYYEKIPSYSFIFPDTCCKCTT